MRHLHLFACLCLLTISGVAAAAAGENSDQVLSDAAAAASESSSNTMEQAAPTAKPVVQRSRREICDTLIESAHSNELPIPFFIHLLFQESGFRPDVVSRAAHRAIHAGDGSDGRPR
jgi:hypothetical protein